MTTYTGKDGLTYDFTNNVLTISGSGQSTALLKGMLTLSDNTTKIDISSVVRIEIGASVSSLNNSAFTDYDQYPPYAPISTCPNLTEINVNSSNTSISSTDGVLYITRSVYISGRWTDVRSLMYYPPKKTGTSFTIPADVRAMEYDAFCGNSTLESVTVPSTIVQWAGQAFGGCTALKSVTLQNSPTTLTSTFYGCIALESFTIPSSVTTIGTRTFMACSSLTSIEIPDTVTSIGENSFAACPSLKTLKLPITINTVPTSYGAFRGTTNIETILFTGGSTGIGPDYTSATTGAGSYRETPWYQSRNSLKEVRFTSVGSSHVSADTIGTNMFRECGLKAIYIYPITTVKEYAFYNSSLEHVMLHLTPTTIGDYAFAGCYDMKGIMFGMSNPQSTITIGTQAFYLGTSEHPAETTVYSEYNKMQGVIDGGAYTTFEFASDFGFCGETVYWVFINDLSGPDTILLTGTLSIRGVGDMDDSYTTSVRPTYDSRHKSYIHTVTVEEGVTSIGKYAFYTFSALKTLTLAGTVATIYDSAFYASGLTSVTLPEGVETLRYGAFNECASLTSVSLPSTLTKIYISSSTEYFPSTIYYDHPGPPFNNCWNLATITVDADNPAFTVQDGALYDKDKTKLILYPIAKTGDRLTLPSTIEYIWNNAIRDNRNLKKLIIPAGVSSLNLGSYFLFGNSDMTVLAFKSHPTLQEGGYGMYDTAGNNYGDQGHLVTTLKVYSSDNWAENELPANPSQYTTLVFSDFPPVVRAKVNGSWVIGTPKVKVGAYTNTELAAYTNTQLAAFTQDELSSKWVTAKAVYVKVNGVWKESERDI